MTKESAGGKKWEMSRSNSAYGRNRGGNGTEIRKSPIHQLMLTLNRKCTLLLLLLIQQGIVIGGLMVIMVRAAITDQLFHVSFVEELGM
jgi:hypothetical protein